MGIGKPILCALAIVTCILIGCNETRGQASVTPLPTAPTVVSTKPLSSNDSVKVTVRELIDRSQEYAGRTVILTGKIVTECPQGCWFFLNDGTASIYIDLQPAGLTIPQKIGARVTIHGKIKGSGGNLMIEADAVDFPE